MPLEMGTRVGVYEVTGKLGEGGMGEVYRAHDTALGRDVALKVLSDSFVADPDRLVRFQREAKVLASLNHSNIGGIYGLENVGDAQALVLELIDGPTLADRINEGSIPVEDSLEIAKQIADALESAHEQGIVHRDLKPANIKVRPDGTVKVLDFGLAKAVSQGTSGTSAAESPTVSLTGATQMGMVIGTAAYMSPEQAKGKPVDKRTDVWAFGAVLYEMLTGKKAFPGDDVSDTLATVLKSEPEWDELPSDTPRSVLRLLHRCLAKDKKNRLREVGSAIVEIHDAEEEQPADLRVSAAPAKSGVLFRPAVVLPAVVAVALLAGLSVWFMTQSVPQPVARFHIPLAAGQVFSAPFRPSVIISPDGLNVVYVANNRLWLRPIDQIEATEISGTDGASSRIDWLVELATQILSGGASAASGGVEQPQNTVSTRTRPQIDSVFDVDDASPIEVRTTSEWGGRFDRLSEDLDIILAVLTAIGVVIAVLSIVNTMLMSVSERMIEFGILKANGWSRSDVLRLIVFESFLVGVTGGVLGSLLGWLGAWLVNSTWPTRAQLYASPNLLIFAVLFSTVLGTIGGLYPAIRAMRMAPMDAIRHG